MVTFTNPFSSTGVQILLKKPLAQTTPLATLLYPFSVGVWVLLLVAFLAIGALLYIIDRFSPYGWQRIAGSSDKRHGRQSFNALNSYLFAISTLSWQGMIPFISKLIVSFTVRALTNLCVASHEGTLANSVDPDQTPRGG